MVWNVFVRPRVYDANNMFHFNKVQGQTN